MGKDVKFGYFFEVGPLDVRFREFEKKYMKEEGKFIQIKIYEEEYIRAGHLSHGVILEKTLNEFGLKFDTIKNKAGVDVHLQSGDNYNLIGAGNIKLFGDKLNFYGSSKDYINPIHGINDENLEDIFGKDNVTELEGFNEPSFLVKIQMKW